MTNNDSYSFLAGGGSPAAKFLAHGDTVGGTITTEPEVQQQRSIEDGTPLTWSDGNPRMQMVVTVQTSLRDPSIEDDDGKRRIFVRGQMRNAVQQAVLATGAKGLDVGGTLTVTYTGDGERKNPAYTPPKLYQATYSKPTTGSSAAFLGNTTTTTTAAAAGGDLPPGLPANITAELWATLTPEAQAALLVSVK